MTLKCCRGNFPILPGPWCQVTGSCVPPLIKSPGEDNEGGEGHSVPVSRAVNEPSQSFTVPREGEKAPIRYSELLSYWSIGCPRSGSSEHTIVRDVRKG